MMKSLPAALVLVSALCAISANADDGMPSNAQLEELGLSSLKVVSDIAGNDVRGRAFGALNVNFLITLSPPAVQTPITGRFVFGTDPAPAGATHEAQLGTAAYQRNPDGSFAIDPVSGNRVLINVPVEISAASLVNGITTVSTYSFEGALFAVGN